MIIDRRARPHCHGFNFICFNDTDETSGCALSKSYEKRKQEMRNNSYDSDIDEGLEIC